MNRNKNKNDANGIENTKPGYMNKNIWSCGRI